jgi:hypothetical protein
MKSGDTKVRNRPIYATLVTYMLLRQLIEKYSLDGVFLGYVDKLAGP